MKKIRIVSAVIFLLIFSFTGSFAQYSTKGFSFQGYAVGSDGKALASAAITAKFTFIPSSGTGLTYSEEQNLTTDIYGVFTSIIGSSTATNKTGGPFEVLNFTSVYYKLKVEVKKTSGGSYTTISDQDLNAVPYAKSADNGVPVGTIISFAGPTSKIPAGWTVCDGRQLDGTTAQYKQLYDMIGNSWGGSGTNFNLPDLRGAFLRGVNEGKTGTYSDPNASTRSASNSGGNTGDKVGTIQTDQTRSHVHGGSGYTDTDGAHQHKGHVTARADNDDNDMPFNYLTYDDVNYYYNTIDIKSNGSEHRHHFSMTTDATGGNETRPVNAAVYYIIKY